MLKSKYTDVICMVIMGIAVLTALLFANGEKLGIVAANKAPDYTVRLFDDSKVHNIDIQVEDWQDFLDRAEEEEYVPCTVTIDGESFQQVGLRTKGNNSLQQTLKYGLDRHSLKLEFDHYQKGVSYHGLDKMSLDESFQDNSYMKTYLIFDMMEYMEVPTPLCSYTWVTVNGEPWGLFLAVEEPEEAFAKRNFGNNYGKLYKPDYKRLKDENADLDLRYISDDPKDYDNIFRNAKFKITDQDRQRLIQALKVLSSGENLESAVNVDQVLRYFAVQVFVLNMDSYLGPTGHNYFLYEEEGRLSMLPWDYNLAFGTYCYGMTDPIRDTNVLINYPIDTPWKGDVMKKRPMFHNLMKHNEYFAGYHRYLEELLEVYFEQGRCEQLLAQTRELIAPYVKQDSTAFCEYEDFLLAADTLQEICRLRAISVDGQLKGEYPSTFREKSEMKTQGVNASAVDIRDLGDFDDLKDG